MDKGLLIRELADIIGVTPDTVINWELRDMQPAKRHISRVSNFIDSIQQCGTMLYNVKTLKRGNIAMLLKKHLTVRQVAKQLGLTEYRIRELMSQIGS